MAGNIPEIVVGVDFGMDSTGISWGHVVDRSREISIVEDWPWTDGAGRVFKNSTSLLYEKDKVIKWGNLIRHEDINWETMRVKIHFKRFLDPKFLQDAQDKFKHNSRVDLPATDAAVDKLFQDYLSKLYSHLEHRWRNHCVDFIFSVPTTWNDKPSVVQRFKTLFCEAGFGKKGNPKHRAFVGDTEAVAAGVYTLSRQKQQEEYSVGDLILICDAGGGTTDLALLKVTATDPTAPRFDILHAPVGCNVGSCDIDKDVWDILVNRNKLLQADSKVSDRNEVLNFLHGKFQREKCGFGEQTGPRSPDHSPDDDDVNDDKGTTEGLVILTNAELQKVFDTKVEKIIQAIDRVLSHAGYNYPSKQISNLVLCGGLGSSKYVQRRLQEHLEQSTEKYPCTVGLKLRTFDERQSRMCVSIGLVHREIQNLARGISRSDDKMLCNPRSYGVEIIEKYNPKIHDKKQVFASLHSKKQYVRTVKWIIEANKGYIAGGHYEQPLHLKIKDGAIPSLSTRLYMSSPSNEADPLSRPGKPSPAYPGCDGVEFLQDLKIDLPPQETHELSLWSKMRHTTPKVVFRAVAELHGFNLVFKLKYANHESAPTTPIRGDWQKYEGDYVPPFAGVGS